MDDFMMGENTLNMTPEVAGLQSVAMTTMSRKFLNCCFKNRHLSLRMLADEVNIGKDTVRKTVVGDLLKWKICSTFFDSRSERPENCSLPRFDCHSRQ